MPSGITHILLVKELLNRRLSGPAREVLSANIDFLQVGAVAPDLPYTAGIMSLFEREDKKSLADRFHYERTNAVPLMALSVLRSWRKLNKDAATVDRAFAFFMGYVSHIVADGIIHPFVRDKVGDYLPNKDAHRVLEMQLDVLFYNRFMARAGVTLAEFNRSNLHDELTNLGKRASKEVLPVMKLLTDAIREVYQVDCSPGDFLKWVKGLHQLVSLAEGSHAEIYKTIGFIESYLFPDYSVLKDHAEDILTLTQPKDRTQNFLGKDRVHFFEDIVPRFFSKLIPLIEEGYNNVFAGKPAFSEASIPSIDLDTGRLVANPSLVNTPTLWT
jgi:hypothetical protein